jgi:hypothetical protein
MQYAKPELNQLGAAESLVLGNRHGNGDGMTGNSTKFNAAFEFEE